MLITDISQITPNVLAAILRHNQFLKPDAGVKNVRTVKSRESTTSRIYHLAITYEQARSITTAPSQVILKLTEAGYDLAEKEVNFYTQVVPIIEPNFRPNELPLLRCYDAYYDPESKQAHLLLEDVSASYYPAREGLPPSDLHQEKVVEGLGRFHAFWWEHAKLGEIGTLYTEERLNDIQSLWQQRAGEYLDFMGFRLPTRHREIIETVTSKWPETRRANLLNNRRVTLVHRDTHPSNFMYGARGIRILDWQSWRLDTGTDDIAYFIACHFPEKVRKFREKRLVQRYYDMLLQQGIKQYTWDDCWYDYLASIARCICFLLVAWSPKTKDEPWMRGENALRAFDELDGLAIY